MLIRTAILDQYTEVLSILTAAALQTDAERIRTAIQRDTVLVALSAPVEQAGQSGESSPQPTQRVLPVLGVLVLEETEITAIAVRPNRRGQGIGSALVTEALRSRTRLVAEFDPSVRPFWESLEFEISQIGGTDRLRGTKHSTDSPA
jgi:ribosomal protein S18 acetylase RimI-like enzyme